MLKSILQSLLFFLVSGLMLSIHGQVRLQATATKSNYIARHNMTASVYQSEFQKNSNNGYRLTDVNGYEVNGVEQYAAIWKKETGPQWTARHGLSEEGYQTAVTNLAKDGYRPARVSAFAVKNTVKFAVIFHKTNNKWAARHDLSSAEYQAAYNTYEKDGYRLIEVCGYKKGNAEKYAAVWEKATGPDLAARHSMNSSQYQQAFEDLSSKGYVPVRVSGFEVNGADQYAAIWEKANKRVYARHGLTSQNYQAEAENFYYQQSELEQVCGYSFDGKVRFAALWGASKIKNEDLSFIEKELKDYVKNFDIPGLSIAIMKDERLVYAQGIGLADKNDGDLVSPNSLFRIASVSKPFTGTAIMKMWEEKKLSLNDKVFGLSGILGDPCKVTANCKDKTDLEKITVRHLLEHSVNWEKDAIWDQTSLNNNDLLAWAIKNYQTQTTPGVQFTYQNFNFFLLARIVEEKSGLSFENYVKNNILSTSGITKMQIGAETAAGRAANEVIYYDGVNNPYNLKMRRMDGNGGWIASSIDLLRFLSSVDKNAGNKDILKSATIDSMFLNSKAKNAGDYAKGWMTDGNKFMHNGCMPGSLSVMVHYPNNISVGMSINTRPVNDQCIWDGMYKVAKKIAESSVSWPGYDLF